MKHLAFLLLTFVAAVPGLPECLRNVLLAALGAIAFGPDAPRFAPPPPGVRGVVASAALPAPAPFGWLRYRLRDGRILYVRNDPLGRARVPLDAVRF
jgi:hypothetical protein